MVDRRKSASYRSVMPAGVQPQVTGPVIVFVAPKMYDDKEEQDDLIKRQRLLNPGAEIHILPPKNADQFILTTLEEESRQGRTFSRIFVSAHGATNQFNSMPKSQATPEGDVDTRNLVEGMANLQDKLRVVTANPHFNLTQQIFFHDCSLLSNATPKDLARYSNAAQRIGATITASSSVVTEQVRLGKLTGDFYDFSSDGKVSHNSNFLNLPINLKREVDVDRSFHGLTGDSVACSAQKSIATCQRQEAPEVAAANQALLFLYNADSPNPDVEKSVDTVLKNARHLPLRNRIGAFMLAALTTQDPHKKSAAIAGWETGINQLPPTERLDLLAERRAVALENKIDPDGHKGTPLGEALDRVATRATREAHGKRGPYAQAVMEDDARQRRLPILVTPS